MKWEVLTQSSDQSTGNLMLQVRWNMSPDYEEPRQFPVEGLIWNIHSLFMSYLVDC